MHPGDSREPLRRGPDGSLHSLASAAPGHGETKKLPKIQRQQLEDDQPQPQPQLYRDSFFATAQKHSQQRQQQQQSQQQQQKKKSQQEGEEETLFDDGAWSADSGVGNSIGVSRSKLRASRKPAVPTRPSRPSTAGASFASGDDDGGARIMPARQAMVDLWETEADYTQQQEQQEEEEALSPHSPEVYDDQDSVVSAAVRAYCSAPVSNSSDLFGDGAHDGDTALYGDDSGSGVRDSMVSLTGAFESAGLSGVFDAEALMTAMRTPDKPYDSYAEALSEAHGEAQGEASVSSYSFIGAGGVDTASPPSQPPSPPLSLSQSQQSVSGSGSGSGSVSQSEMPYRHDYAAPLVPFGQSGSETWEDLLAQAEGEATDTVMPLLGGPPRHFGTTNMPPAAAASPPQQQANLRGSYEYSSASSTSLLSEFPVDHLPPAAASVSGSLVFNHDNDAFQRTQQPVGRGRPQQGQGQGMNRADVVPAGAIAEAAAGMVVPQRIAVAPTIVTAARKHGKGGRRQQQQQQHRVSLLSRQSKNNMQAKPGAVLPVEQRLAEQRIELMRFMEDADVVCGFSQRMRAV